MASNPVFKYLGLVSCALLFTGLAFILIKWPRGGQYTFSQHIAQYKSSIIYYIVLFGITLPLLILFFLYWFSPTFGLSNWFNVWLVLAAIFQLLCTFIPEIDGWKSTWHRRLAGVSAACLQPPILIVALSSHFYLGDRIIASISFVIMFGLMILMTKNKAQHSNFLAIQAVYYTAFFAPFLVISYL